MGLALGGKMYDRGGDAHWFGRPAPLAKRPVRALND